MTIYDIAKEAGVSASTVSRVITGKVKVKQSTKDKVTALLEKYDFTPDENARVLVRGSSKLIGIVVEDIRNGHHSSIFYSIEKRLRKKGYCGIGLNSGSDIKRIDSCIGVLTKRRVDGIIFVGSLYQEKEVVACIEKNFPQGPTVLVNGEYSSDTMWSIIANEYDGIGKCVDLFCEKGRKNIIYIQKPRTASGLRKKEGFIKRMKELGFSDSEIIILDSEPTAEDGYAVTKAALSKHKNVNAILYSEDLIATGGIKALKELGKSVPEDISVIGIDNSLYGTIITPMLTSLDTGMEALSEAASELIVDVIHGKEHSKLQKIDIDIVQRETT